MNNLHRHLPVLLISVLLLPAIGLAAPMTWEEHREAAHAQLRYGLADPVTPAQHLEKALTLAREQKVEPAVIGDLMDRLADAYSIEDQREKGRGSTRQQTTLLETVRYKEEMLGEYAPELAPTLRKLSDLRFRQGRNLEGFQLAARALTILIRHYGRESAEVADGYTYLGVCYDYVGDRVQAETYLRKAVEIVRGLSAPPSETYAGAFGSLAAALRKSDREEEAKALEAEYIPVAARLGAQAREAAGQEARAYEHLPRAPSSDVVPLSREEVAARVAAGWATTTEPAKPPSR